MSLMHAYGLLRDEYEPKLSFRMFYFFNFYYLSVCVCVCVGG